MHVSFERVGGFAGLRLAMTLDSDNLDAVEASRLEDEVRQAGFFNLPEKLNEPGGGADRFEYRIEIDWDDQHHAIRVGEAAIPDSLRSLVEHLEWLLRTRRLPRSPG